MEFSTDRKESTSSSPTSNSTPTTMEKPQIHTTESGSQSVRAVDVVRSKAGWAEIQRLKEADLVRPVSANSNNNSSHSNDKR